MCRLLYWYGFCIMWYWTSDLKHELCVSFSTGIIRVSFYNDTVNKKRHYVLDDSLTGLGVDLVFDQWFRQTLYGSYFTEILLGSFGNGKVNKSGHYVLYILLGLLSIIVYRSSKWNMKLYVSEFNQLIRGSFGIVIVI